MPLQKKVVLPSENEMVSVCVYACVCVLFISPLEYPHPSLLQRLCLQKDVEFKLKCLKSFKLGLQKQRFAIHKLLSILMELTLSVPGNILRKYAKASMTIQPQNYLFAIGHVN